MKKISLILIAMFAMVVLSNAQTTSVVGKWKAVSFDMAGMMKIDLKTGKTTNLLNLDSLFKNDADPKTSKQMIEFVFEMMTEKMQRVNEEYLPNGKYFEINTKENSKQESTYSYNTQKKTVTLTNVLTKKVTVLNIEFTTTGFIASFELSNSSPNSKKGTGKIVYEKAN